MNTESNAPIALVTGASRGLGRSAALHLARSGHDLVITYRERADEAETARREIESLGRRAAVLQLDAAEVESFPGFGERLDALLRQQWRRSSFDYLVNNAGTSGHMKLGETTLEGFDALVAIHLRGMYFLTQQLLPRIADGGGIVCLSTAMTRSAMPAGGPYSAVKAAVEMLVPVWAKELGPRRIRVNAVAPGAVPTDFSRAVWESSPQIREQLIAVTALGRIAEPDDIGPVVAFLCSDAARWVNAQRIEASGGQGL